MLSPRILSTQNLRNKLQYLRTNIGFQTKKHQSQQQQHKLHTIQFTWCLTWSSNSGSEAQQGNALISLLRDKQESKLSAIRLK